MDIICDFLYVLDQMTSLDKIHESRTRSINERFWEAGSDQYKTGSETLLVLICTIFLALQQTTMSSHVLRQAETYTPAQAYKYTAGY